LQKSLGLLDEAVNAGGPFFLTVAPIGPHANMHFPDPRAACLSGLAADEAIAAAFSKPRPQSKYQNAFPSAQVPRTPDFNPKVVSSFYPGLSSRTQNAFYANQTLVKVGLSSYCSCGRFFAYSSVT
jgi:hypothetical protein